MTRKLWWVAPCLAELRDVRPSVGWGLGDDCVSKCVTVRNQVANVNDEGAAWAGDSCCWGARGRRREFRVFGQWVGLWRAGGQKTCGCEGFRRAGVVFAGVGRARRPTSVLAIGLGCVFCCYVEGWAGM